MTIVLPAERSLQGAVQEDLTARKMVFIAGPRQCGKTTFARAILRTYEGGKYFNWDIAGDRAILRKGTPDLGAPIWAFDELHKMRQWRGYLKGLFDEHGRDHRILVTGSARLDLYARGGDSLQGRYYLHRMHPFTLRELLGAGPPSSPDDVVMLSSRIPRGADDALSALFALSGFPEPLDSGSERRAARWRLAYGARLVREDIRDLETIRDLDRLELLFDRFPLLVGSVLSINALREDLDVAFDTVKSYVQIFERLFAVYRVPPFGNPRIKAVKKEQKLYLWDWSRVDSPGPRFENLVMSHLLRLVHHMEDAWGEKAELRYVRDVVGHEVDALVLRKGKPWMLVEMKLGEEMISSGLKYIAKRMRVPHLFQVSLRSRDHRIVPLPDGQRVHCVPATKFLFHLP